MRHTIYVTQGEVAYVGGTITAADGADITADPIVMAFGPADKPPALNTGQTPDVDTPGATTAQRDVWFKVDATMPPPGVLVYVWAWITDSPEVAPLRLDGPFAII